MNEVKLVYQSSTYMGSNFSSSEDLFVRLVTNSMEYVLVNWVTEEEVEIVKSSYRKPWFEETRLDLTKVCRYRDLVKVRAHFKKISSDPTDVHFCIKTPQELLPLYASSQLVNKERYSIWIKLPELNAPIYYIQDAVHDMKSPVNSIIGVANLMQHSLEQPGELDRQEMKTYLDLVMSNAHKSVSLLNEVMELAEMESPNYSLSKEKIQLADFVEVYLNTHRLLTIKKKIKVHFENKVSGEVEVNKSKMTRVLDNVLSNAVKFSEHNSNIYVKLSEEKKHVVISIRDEGIGIPERIKNELFVKFGNAKRRGLDGEDSHGLGMSIIKQIMDLHEGLIEVESEEGKGTEIKLKLKKAENEEDTDRR